MTADQSSLIQYQRRWIPDGSAGTDRVLNIMRQYVNFGKKDPLIRQRALIIVQNASSKNWETEVKLLQIFCRDKVKYRKDILGVETLQTPRYTLQMMQGDCDDKTTLFCALAESIGHETRMRAVGKVKNHYQHVLPEVLIQRQGARAKTWMPVELTATIPFGTFPPMAANMYK